MTVLDFIIWYPTPEIFAYGRFAVRWYGLLFALGFIVGQYLMMRIYRAEGRPVADIEPLTVFMIVGTIIGARLGHCLFYNPYYYFWQAPLDVFKIWEGGLASHGGAIGILVSLWLFVHYHIGFKGLKPEIRKTERIGQDYLWLLDRMVILVALGACFIRLGNFINSEIIGKPTNADLGVVFVRSAHDVLHSADMFGDNLTNLAFERNGQDTTINGQKLVGLDVEMVFAQQPSPMLLSQVRLDRVFSAYFEPERHFELLPKAERSLNTSGLKATYQVYGRPRHAAQLYESISSLLLFAALMAVWIAKKQEIPRGRLLAIFLIVVFGLRIFYETLKENQEAWETQYLAEYGLNQGMLLSVPLVLAGIWLLVRSFRQAAKTP